MATDYKECTGFARLVSITMPFHDFQFPRSAPSTQAQTLQ